MKWPELLELVGHEPVFTANLLRAGMVSDGQLRLQLTRWTKAGKVIKLRRGVYVLAAPYRKVEPHPFVIANYLRKNSYVSLQSALAYHGLIPEHVPVVMSVTAARPENVQTMMGNFGFRHVHRSHLFGYEQVAVSRQQDAFVATPEKALLDLVYLTPRAEQLPYLQQLRLQNLNVVNRQVLTDFVYRFDKRKLHRALRNLSLIIDEDAYESL